MSAGVRLLAFAAALAVVGGVGAAAGAVIDPAAPGGEVRGSLHGGEMAAMAGGHAAAAVRGLAVADGGLRLVVDDQELRRGRLERVSFRVLDRSGRPVRDFDVEHTRRMHMIVARRDLTAFLHLHPRMNAGGTWTARLRLRDPGSYRLFADFARGGRAFTLASDLRVDGRADLRPLPAVAPSARTAGGYEVTLAGGAAPAGEESALRFAVTRDGRPVRTRPYLGAGGHLVALREGDLAFLHVHPRDGLGFETTFPIPGRYRLFLQFRVGDSVETAAFTREVS